MYRTCIAIVDATRARLFTHDRTADAEGIHEQLLERRDLVNPARHRRPSELFSDTRPGSVRAGGLHYEVDDHRDAHLDELDVVFSRAITAELAELLRSTPAQHLIVCASPRMLGHLRDARHALRDAPPIDEIPRDLVKLTPTQLHEHLVSYGFLQAAAARR